MGTVWPRLHDGAHTDDGAPNNHGDPIIINDGPQMVTQQFFQMLKLYSWH